MEVNQTYNSASKGRLYIPDMEDNHLRNAYAKLCRLRDNGEDYPVAVLASLKAEIAKRDTAKNFVPTAEKKEEGAGGLPEGFINFLAELAHDIGNLAILNPGIGEINTKVQSFTQKVNSLGEVKVNLTGEKACDVPTPKLSKETELKDVAAFQDSATLLNSLATYGITTVGDLADISISDFATVRFSTPQAFLDATNLLYMAGLNWSNTSVILSVDGYINRILNPNVSDITTFVMSAEGRLQKQLDKWAVVKAASVQSDEELQDSPQVKEILAAIDRIFSGVKRRVALAASTVGTSLFARGYTSTTAHDVIGQLNNTMAFKHQVTLYLNRVTQRVLRTVTSPPVPGTLELVCRGSVGC